MYRKRIRLSQQVYGAGNEQVKIKSANQITVTKPKGDEWADQPFGSQRTQIRPALVSWQECGGVALDMVREGPRANGEGNSSGAGTWNSNKHLLGQAQLSYRCDTACNAAAARQQPPGEV